jgi:hypothetical protein
MADVTVTNLRAGAGVLFKGAGLSSSPAVSMGASNGGINVNVESEFFDLTTDQTGTSAADKLNVGFKATIEANLAEVTLDNIARAFAGVLVSAADPNNVVKLNGNIGQQALRDGYVDQYTILPQLSAGNYSTNSEEAVVIPKGYAMGNMSLPYGVTDLRVFPCTIEALPDTNDNNTRIMFGLNRAVSAFIRS